MKLSKIAILTMLWAPSMALATEIHGDIANAVDEAGFKKLSGQYGKFLVNDFVTSDYCQTGWGDEPDAGIQMQAACNQVRDVELKKLGLGNWSTPFRFDFAKVTENEIFYRFERYPEMDNASLSCMFTYEFKVNANNKELISSDIDLYCDH